MCAGIWSVTRRGRRSRSTVAQPGLCEREGKKKKEKREKVVLHLLEENIKQPLLGVPPLLLPPTGAPSARIFSCTPTSFFNLFSSFNILVEKGARLVETVHAPIFHARITPGWGQGTKTGTPPPPPPVPAQPAPSFFDARFDPRPVKEEVATKKGA